ncbi:hypothetical protein AOX55_00001376 [Sinorhizobium fredii CCBAU 25509]|nr:hypothetical protein AOX55_00001376 [Sinorhizobium fredii CCBAU 25509]
MLFVFPRLMPTRPSSDGMSHGQNRMSVNRLIDRHRIA